MWRRFRKQRPFLLQWRRLLRPYPPSYHQQPRSPSHQPSRVSTLIQMGFSCCLCSAASFYFTMFRPVHQIGSKIQCTASQIANPCFDLLLNPSRVSCSKLSNICLKIPTFLGTHFCELRCLFADYPSRIFTCAAKKRGRPAKKEKATKLKIKIGAPPKAAPSSGKKKKQKQQPRDISSPEWPKVELAKLTPDDIRR